MKKFDKKVHDPILEKLLARYPKPDYKEPPKEKEEKKNGRKKQ